MSPRVLTLALAGLLAAVLPARDASAGTHVHYQHAPGCPQGHAQGCVPQAHCGHQHGDHRYPCAIYLKFNCDPLPPISLSRYADNGDYDCPKHYFGDACPHCPRYWINNQRYAVPHDYNQDQGGQNQGQGGQDQGQGYGQSSG